MLPPVLRLRADELAAERPEGADDDDEHMLAAVAAAAVSAFSVPGDRVLDPFAGFGTTLAAADRLGRTAVGVELTAERVAVARRRAPAAQVVQGDARRLRELAIGPVDLCLTSPPYMTAVDHPDNPLTAYSTTDGDYRTYLRELRAVFDQVAELLAPGGHVVVNAATLRMAGHVTPLAWDIVATIAPPLAFRGECVLDWDRRPSWMWQDYLLVFRHDAASAAR